MRMERGVWARCRDDDGWELGGGELEAQPRCGVLLFCISAVRAMCDGSEGVGLRRAVGCDVV